MAVMRVLVVEDEVRMAALLRRGLSEEGYAVDVAGDGPQAVWRPTEFSYDAVVLDVLLPGLDGFEVCRRLRAGGHGATGSLVPDEIRCAGRVAGTVLGQILVLLPGACVQSETASAGLAHDADVGLGLLPLAEDLPGLVVGDRAGDDDVLARLPVDRGGDAVPGGQLQRVDHPQDL